MTHRVALARALRPESARSSGTIPFAALDALTRSSLQRIQLLHKRARTCLVTHHVREAVCLATRPFVLWRQPWAIREHSMSRSAPRDINSIELAEHAGKITRALKGHSAGEVSE